MTGFGGEDDPATRAALAARNGDRAAATVFIEQTQRTVHRFLGHLCDARDVADLTQETYLRALRALPGFAGQSSARTWLLAIARRVAADHVRTAMRRPRTTPLYGHEAALDAAGPQSGFEDGVLLRHLLDGLTPQRREAFVATQVLGLSYEDAARVCDCPVGTIRSRVARARDDLIRAYRADQPGPQHRRTGT